MADFPWFKYYPATVDKTVNVTAYSNISELFDECVSKYGSAVAYECMGKTLSFEDLGRLSANFATYLTEVLQLKKGTRIAIQMPNVLQYPVAMFGALRAG